jgi:hypothetical protein
MTFERLLVPPFTKLPACRCGHEMSLAAIDPLPHTTDAHVRMYRCPECHHQMRLTVWADATETVQVPPATHSPDL